MMMVMMSMNTWCVILQIVRFSYVNTKQQSLAVLIFFTPRPEMTTLRYELWRQKERFLV